MLVHGAFIFFLLGRGFPEVEINGILSFVWHNWMWIALVGLFFEHAREFSADYLGKGENRKTTAIIQMIAPYGRIIVMHVVIIAGGFLLVFLRLPRLMAILLVVAKIMIELAKKRQQTARDLGDSRSGGVHFQVVPGQGHVTGRLGNLRDDDPGTQEED